MKFWNFSTNFHVKQSFIFEVAYAERHGKLTVLLQENLYFSVGSSQNKHYTSDEFDENEKTSINLYVFCLPNFIKQIYFGCKTV